MGRAPCCDKANVKRGPWAPEEDAKLKAYIEEHGTGGNWIALPHKIGLKRCGKSCRLRWLNYLRPNIKHGGFSEEEDNIICSLYISIGSRWSIIAAQLPGRTDNDIKNYWNTRLKKKLLGRRKESQSRRSSLASTQEQKDEMEGINCGSTSSSQALSNSAIERMQLHMQLQGLNSPFSFYNNPALWPKLHSLGDKVLQTQQSADQPMSYPSHVNQLPLITTQEPSLNPSLPSHDQRDHHALNGFSSASTSAGFDVDKMSANGNQLSSAALGLQEELTALIYGKNNGCSEPHGSQQQPSQGLDCFKEMDSDKDGMIWWASNGFGEKSSSSSWESAAVDLQPDSIFQDYMLGYGI